MQLTVGKISPLYLRESKTFKVSLKEGARNSALEQASIMQAMATLDEAARSHIQEEDLSGSEKVLLNYRRSLNTDTPSWGPDCDPDPSRIVKTISGLRAPRLDAGIASLGMVLHLDPKTRQPKQMDIESDQGNMTTHVKWTRGQITAFREERVLFDGRVESLEMKLDARNGVINCRTDIQG